MNTRRTALLAVITALLGLFIWKYELPKDEAKRRKESILNGLSIPEVKSVTIAKRDSPPFTLWNRLQKKLVKNEINDYKAWELRVENTVIDTLLDTGAVSSIMGALESLKLSDSISASEREADRAIYGLDKPEMTIGVEGPFGTRRVFFGKRSEFTQQRYLGFEGSDDIYLIQDFVFDQASRSRDEFRKKTRIEVPTWSVKKVTLENAKGKVELAQPTPNSWSITSPRNLEADESAVNELFRRLQALKVEKFIDEPNRNLGKFGLENPDAKITVVTQNGSQEVSTLIRLALTQGEEPVMRLALSDQVPYFELEGNSISNYLLTAQELRLKRLFKFDPYEVASFTVAEKDKVLVKATLTKKSEPGTQEVWTINEKLGDEPFVREYLRNVTAVDAVDFPKEEQSLEIVDPLYTLTFEVGEKSNSEKTHQRIFKVASKTEKSGKPLWLVVENNVGVYLDEEGLKTLIPKVETFIKMPSPTPVSKAPTDK